ncbi:hypothetical protein FGO68_gene2562 [Halteria grandinella]|uniref:Ribonuclease P/MRP protein subunit POP5 n=1 Tax=Halteria grandinella TaxID=5974 RepID=A0A8J8SW53_HALGN|nr:hypothetical protein FGO68_gene2562 [Halteria grandinella]
MVRVKQRYILGEIHLEEAITSEGGEQKFETITQKDVQQSFRDAVVDAYGDLGIAKLQPNFLIKYWNPTTRVFILRVGREDEKMAQVSLTLMTKLTGCAGPAGSDKYVCKVRVIHVGGTLEKVEKALKDKTECWLEGQAKAMEVK